MHNSFSVVTELNACDYEYKTSERKGQQFFLVVVVPLTCYDYFSFLQMIVNLIFLETSGFTQ